MNYLTKRVEKTRAKQTEELIHESTDFVSSSPNQPTITSKKELQTRIVDMIHNQNDTWGQSKQHQLMR